MTQTASKPWLLVSASARRDVLRWAILLAAALGLRSAGIASTSVWLDEAYTLMAARIPWGDLLLRFPLTESNPPLHFIITKLAGYVSDAEEWYRFVNVALGMALVVFTVLWVRFAETRAGWAAGWLVATCPLFCHYSQEIRPYSLTYLCIMISLWSLEAQAHGRRGYRWVWPIALGLSVASHFVCWLAVPVILAYAWVRGAWRIRSPGPLLLLACLCAIPGYLAWHHTQIRAETGLYYPPFTWASARRIFEGLIGVEAIEAWRGDPAPWGREILALLCRTIVEVSLGIALALPLLTGNRSMRRSVSIALGSALTFLILGVGFGLLVTPIFMPRTAALIWFPIIWIIAHAARTSATKRWRRVGTACVAAVSAVWGLVWVQVALSDYRRRPPERELCQYLADRAWPEDWFVSFMAARTWTVAYCLRDRVCGEHLLDLEFPAYVGCQPVRMIPVPERADPNWFERFTQAIGQDFAGPTPGNVWILDSGFGSAGDANQHRFQQWLEEQGYRPFGGIFIPEPWTMSATRWTRGGKAPAERHDSEPSSN